MSTLGAFAVAVFGALALGLLCVIGRVPLRFASTPPAATERGTDAAREQAPRLVQ